MKEKLINNKIIWIILVLVLVLLIIILINLDKKDNNSISNISEIEINDEEDINSKVTYGTTIFNVTSNDNDIVSYNYNNIKTTKSKSFTLKGFIRNKSYVILTDKYWYSDLIQKDKSYTNMEPISLLITTGINFSVDYQALRQAICQIDTNNFILVTSNIKTLLGQLFANYLGSLGCKTAFNLDGGGSTTLMYKSKDSNSVNAIKGGSRSVTMILYFTELN